MLLRYFIIISGIFGKRDETLDILPPPPPFPEIGKEEKKEKDEDRIKEKGGNRKERELNQKRKEEEQNRKQKDRRIAEERKKEIEKERQRNIEKKREEVKQGGKDLTKKKAEEKRIIEEIEKRRLETLRREEERKQKLEKEELKREKSEIEFRNKKLNEKLKKDRRKKVFNLFHDLGFVKTQKEKKDFERQKRHYKIQKEIFKKKNKEVMENVRLERQIELDNIKSEKQREFERNGKEKKELDKGKQRIHEDSIPKQIGLISRKEDIPELIQKPEKKSIFGKIFGRKKPKTEFEQELEDLDKIASIKKTKTVPKLKLDMSKIKVSDIENLEKETTTNEVVNEKEEIQKAIEGIKGKKKFFKIKGLFKKKVKGAEKTKIRENQRFPLFLGNSKKFEEISSTNQPEKVETPEVMPRTYDKIDHVQLIEERVHKARLVLMDFKFDQAKSIYIEIMEMYNNLEPKKKSRVYQDINDLYYERKSAEKFSK